MNTNFYPSIHGIHFKNFDMVEDFDGIKHLRGDLYLNGECVGYYNPVYQTEEDKPATYFLRLENEYQSLYEIEKMYESLFNKKAVPLAEYDCPVGLQELISDLEIITYLYEFMHSVRPNNDFNTIGLIGLINGADTTPLVKVIQINDTGIVSNDQIVEFINNKVESIHLNSAYPTLIFKSESDFVIM